MKCDKCGAPVRPMPPDGDILYDAPRAYAATLAPQAAPVAGGKPTPEMLKTARKICDAYNQYQGGVGSSYQLQSDIANALAAAAQKAALEAEARVAEMREQLTKAPRWLEIARDCAADLYDEPEGWPPHKDDPLFWFNGLTRYIEDMAALPSPSSDRFMRLLEAVRAHENHWMPLDVRNALAAFPQPQEQP